MNECFTSAVTQSADGLLFIPSVPILIDIDILPVKLDPSLFPGVSSDVKVHAGFGLAHKSFVLLSRTPGGVLLILL